MSDRSGDRRTRGLLRSYYGLGNESSKSDPLDPDAPDFDPDLFLKKIVQERDLHELLREDNKTVTEIRSLDSDMKTLVYENYSKFISATETIKKMKQNVENMDSEMEKLRQNMSKISEGSANINTSLVEKRDRINQLSGVHSLLKKLQFVFELPAKLRLCLEKQTYSQAYKYYTKTSDILKHYNHLPSFANIQSESDAIMREMVVKLKKKLINETTKSSELSECVRILLGLKEPPEKLWKDYLQFQLRELKKSLKFAEAECDRLKPEIRKKPKAQPSPKPEATQAFEESDDDSSSVKSDQVSVSSSSANKALEPEEEMVMETIVDPIRKVSILNEYFLKEFTDFVSSFVVLFIKPLDSGKILSDENLKKADRDLLNVMDEIAQLYFASVEAKCLVLNIQDPTLIPSPFSFVALLSKMHKDIGVLDVANPHARLADRNRRMTSDFLLNYTNSMFGLLEADVKASLAKVSTQISQNQTPLNNLVTPFCTEFLENTKKHLSNLEIFIHSEAKFMGEHGQIFIHDILRKSTSFIHSFLAILMEHGMKPQIGASNTYDPLLLVLTKICQEFETTFCTKFFIYIADNFFPTSKKTVGQEAKTAVNLMKENSQKMLNSYVELTGQNFTTIIRSSIETRKWMTPKEPRKVSPVWEILMNDLTQIQKACDLLFPDESKPKSGSDSSRGGSRQSATGRSHARVNPLGDQFMSNIDKLFSDNIEIFGSVEFKRGSIMMAIVKINIKTLIECLRLCTFSRAGYQQIQVDIEFLRVRFWRFVTNEGVLNRLLDEVLVSVQNRCVDPTPMEQSVVQKIAGESGTTPGQEQTKDS